MLIRKFITIIVLLWFISLDLNAQPCASLYPLECTDVCTVEPCDQSAYDACQACIEGGSIPINQGINLLFIGGIMLGGFFLWNNRKKFLKFD